VGTRAGKKVVAVLTRMDEPLGATVGNAIETREAIEVLHGKGPADLVECTMILGAEMLVMGGKVKNVHDARIALDHAVKSGAALSVMEKMVAAQGGDASVVRDPARLRAAEVAVEVTAPRDGFVTGIDALAIGLSGVAIGAGRTRADQAVDPEVGITLHVKTGAKVVRGQPMATLHVRSEESGRGIRGRVMEAFALGDAAPAAVPLVVGRIE
jgi:pyrimidine-nucleoside phosphorylase